MLEQLYKFVLEQISKNDLLAGGAILGALAIVLNYLKRIPLRLIRISRFLFITEIDIPDKTDAFKWVTDWLAEHKYSSKSKRITVESKKISISKNSSSITPAPGSHLLWWRYRPLIITRIRKEGSDFTNAVFRESWKIRMIGNRKRVKGFIDECKNVSEQERESFINIREPQYGSWEQVAKRRKRLIDSVILPIGIKEELLNDINEFLNSEQWFKKIGVPWRRGYLLCGSPGNGKSSLVTAVASELDLDIYIANINGMGDKELSDLFSRIYGKSILLLEDIDCILANRDEKNNGPNLSTLLNALDGVNAGEGRLVFMTTNHVDKLDPALIRPGRIDLKIALPNATAYQAREMYKRFFPGCKNASEFGEKVSQLNISMAILQAYLIKHRKSMRDARANIKELEDAKV